MSKLFDMELFLAGVLTGSNATRQRHLRQATLIQAEIADRWQRENPWTWRRKHLAWFLEHRLARRCKATRYYYLLTVQLLVRRLGKAWLFKCQTKV
ncbi:hypothetical protein C5609_09250 [Pseudomonas putida]|uniref:hypothetical protein n=1 Tax=Pseudomonas putida TaxID=303 RepID=UPI000FA8266B|nr:hypothetical protein [Pseudomonas putida]TFF52147.1 hypothetical protein C5609_09250 [Pseudomonas putida]